MDVRLRVVHYVSLANMYITGIAGNIALIVIWLIYFLDILVSAPHIASHVLDHPVEEDTIVDLSGTTYELSGLSFKGSDLTRDSRRVHQFHRVGFFNGIFRGCELLPARIDDRVLLRGALFR